jgi:DNA-binding NarL/FixJ family response regulator
MDGIETIRRIREFDEKAGIVILANGNKDKIENQIEGLDVWSVCEKPVSLEKLAPKVSDACQFAHLSPKIAMDFQQETEATQAVRRSFKAETRFPAPKTERRQVK